MTDKREVFQGVKVVDFGWSIADALCALYLGDHGATVIRIETAARLDIIRVAAPFKDDKIGPNRAAMFAQFNRNKYGVTINLKHPKGVELAKRLVAWADIVTEGYMAGAMGKLGLGYEELKRVKPDIIMISLSLLGQTGPLRRHAAYGHQLTSWMGTTQITGWPDRSPAEVYIYTDFLGGMMGAIALIAALDYRRRTGKGQYLDLSQHEASLQFLAPVFADYAVNGRVWGRSGNRVPSAAPHGAYRCRGDDRWCAIAVSNDTEWQAMCEVMGKIEWTKNHRFATLRGRKHDEDELDRLIEEWTIQHTAEEVMNLLQSAGVAAGVVSNGEDLVNDPQLTFRQHFWVQDHVEIGSHRGNGPAFKLSKTPAKLRLPGPLVGQHNEYVCTQILGMADDEFLDFLASGAME